MYGDPNLDTVAVCSGSQLRTIFAKFQHYETKWEKLNITKQML